MRILLAQMEIRLGEKKHNLSKAIGPWGNVLAKAGQVEEFITVNLDPAKVGRTRQAFPVLGDVRLI